MQTINPIVKKCEALREEGYSVSAVTIRRTGENRLQVNISMNTFVPEAEGSDEIGNYSVVIDRKNLPNGMTIGGFSRVPDEIMHLAGNEEQAEALIKEVATVGEACDFAKFNGDTPDYPHWLTKPDKWFLAARKRNA